MVIQYSLPIRGMTRKARSEIRTMEIGRTVDDPARMLCCTSSDRLSSPLTSAPDASATARTRSWVFPLRSAKRVSAFSMRSFAAAASASLDSRFPAFSVVGWTSRP